MSNRIRFTSARQIVEAFPGAAEELGEIPERASPLEFLASLRARAYPGEGLLYAALMLPKREAVWWACLCVRGLRLDGAKVAEGLSAAEAWVRNPEEDERRATGEVAESHSFSGPGAMLAFAAFASGGSLSAAGLQAVPPPAETCGRALYAALLQAVGDDDPLMRIAKIRCALDSARDFAEGGDGKKPWQAGPRVEPLAPAGSDA